MSFMSHYLAAGTVVPIVIVLCKVALSVSSAVILRLLATVNTFVFTVGTQVFLKLSVDDHLV